MGAESRAGASGALAGPCGTVLAAVWLLLVASGCHGVGPADGGPAPAATDADTLPDGDGGAQDAGAAEDAGVTGCAPGSPGWRTAPSSTSVDVEARRGHSVVWTGREVLVFGGENPAAGTLRTGGAFNPAAGTWRAIPRAPSERSGHQAVYTGREMVVFGGYVRWSWPPVFTREGLIFTPEEGGAWRTLPAAPLEPRTGFAMVFADTTDELLVWGGGQPRESVDAAQRRFADGAALELSTGRWRMLPPSPLFARDNVAAVWTGTEMVVYGGEVGFADAVGDAAAYEPRTDTWTRLEVPPGLAPRRMHAGLLTAPGVATFFGGDNTACSEECLGPSLNDGASYDAATGTWTLIPAFDDSVLTPASRVGRSVVAGNGRLFVVGGEPFEERRELSDGAVYEPSTRTWSHLPSGPAPIVRAGSVWTGCELVFYGGALNGTGQTLLYRP